MFALDDFVHKHYGKIDPQKVFPMDEKEDSIWQIVKNEDIVYIEFPYEEKNISYGSCREVYLGVLMK